MMMMLMIFRAHRFMTEKQFDNLNSACGGGVVENTIAAWNGDPQRELREPPRGRRGGETPSSTSSSVGIVVGGTLEDGRREAVSPRRFSIFIVHHHERDAWVSVVRDAAVAEFPDVNQSSRFGGLHRVRITTAATPQ